ncbi:MAG: hypothetical protein JW774_07045 [Candidatus Aureabacteria bacterium]|nr:hypothetical protein [Candidatus Auribacterota bacterium]
MNKSKQALFKRGNILVVTLVAVVIGGMVVGSLMKFVAMDNFSVEKEIGHVKSSEALKLSMQLYNTTVANQTTAVTQTVIDRLTQLIGGGGISKPIFGSSSGGTQSSVPGFNQFSVLWNDSQVVSTTALTPPAADDPTGFWYYPGTATATVVATHTGQDVPAVRNGSKAMVSSGNTLRTIPAFSMLSFYDRDWEVSAHYESAQLIGRIHSNGNIYLDCRDQGNDRVRFHGQQNYPILSSTKQVFRRGRNGATSWYKFGTIPNNQGLNFYEYSQAVFESVINYNQMTGLGDFNYTDYVGSAIFAKDMTPDYTNYETGAVTTDSSPSEWVARRFGGSGTNFGYVFNGTRSTNPGLTPNTPNTNDFMAPTTTGGSVAVVQSAIPRLSPPVAINPYQYIEDTQFYDTPDTIPQPGVFTNYQADASSGGKVAALAYNSIAPLVIRDGVAYYRNTPGGTLQPVMNLIAGNSETLYPDDTHPAACRYGDLRWYGHFGQNDAIPASPSNPDRWHFPIRSVTLNTTTDANNAGDGTTSAEGTAVPFTYNSTTVLNPVNDGIRDLAGSVVPTTWITRSREIRDNSTGNGIAGYPPCNTSAPADASTGSGVGMWYASYNTIDTNNNERYDPVRVAYNLVKDEVRRMHNNSHAYTSRMGLADIGGGVMRMKMLNANGSYPGNNVAPNVWGAGSMPDAAGVDYDNIDVDNNDTTDIDYSAFWNDDGGRQTGFQYLRLNITASANAPRIYNISYGSATTSLGSPALPMTADTAPFPQETTASSVNSTYAAYRAFDSNTTGTDWRPTAAGASWITVKLGIAINPTTVTIRLSGTSYGPSSFTIQGSNTGAFTGEEVLLGTFNSVTWSSTLQTFNLPGSNPLSLYNGFSPDEYFYSYRRDQNSTNTNASRGEIYLGPVRDSTARVELFPIRHDSLCTSGTAYSPMTNWFVYKSTLPLCDRSVPMPESYNALNYPLTGNSTTNLCRNSFGFAGTPDGFHNYYLLLNNAPEILARVSTSGQTFETDNTGGFYYYGGDNGGYYGVDNLCMIDAQEKKIVVFTEIDLSELTPECFTFNGLDTAWGFNFNNNTATATANTLQNLIYVVNTTMGNNFFGKRVHCGAVRLKRGAVIQFPLAVGSPNAIHIWGDYNCPGYWHHGMDSGYYSVSYAVPTTREHDSATTVTTQRCALYGDTIYAYETNWIRLDKSDSSRDQITDRYYGTMINTIGMRGDQNICYDHKLWWEDDGMRRAGQEGITGSANLSNRGAQLFINYHEMLFDIVNNDYFSLDASWGDSPGSTTNNRRSSNQIWKHAAQGINAAMMYGNVESRLPSFFWASDVSVLPACPASVSLLDWYMSWIPRTRWIEAERNQMRNDMPNTMTNGGFNPSTVNAAYINANLSPSNYLGTTFGNSIPSGAGSGPSSASVQWENCKLKFSGGGFLFDIRVLTNQTFNLQEWNSNSASAPGGRTFTGQEFGRNIRGSFACLFDCRQNTHGWNTTLVGSEGHQLFYSYNIDYNNSDNLPPGTPMTTNVPPTQYALQGTKWTY